MNHIYFIGPEGEKERDKDFCSCLFGYLSSYGSIVQGSYNELWPNKKNHLKLGLFTREKGILDEFNIFIAEITNPRVELGCEVGRILERNLWVPENQKKEILLLSKHNKSSELISMVKSCSGVCHRTYKSWGEVILRVDNFFNSLTKPEPGFTCA